MRIPVKQSSLYDHHPEKNDSSAETLLDIVRDSKLKDRQKIDKIVARLEAKNGDLLERGESGMTVLHEACFNGGVELIEWLLLMKPELLNAVTEYGTNVLCYALKYANKPLVDYFLQRAPELINAVNKNHFSPLNFAAMGGDISVYLKLFEKLKSVSKKAVIGERSPLQNAIESGKLDFIKAYMQLDPKQHTFTIYNIVDGLVDARVNKNLDALDWFKEQGLELTSPTDDDVEKLHASGVTEPKFEVRFLLNYRKNKLFKGKKLAEIFIAFNLLNKPIEDGYYPLHIVIQNNDQEAVAALLEAGVSIEQPSDTDGSTPLLIALEEKNIEMVQLLTDYKARYTFREEPKDFIKSKELTINKQDPKDEKSELQTMDEEDDKEDGKDEDREEKPETIEKRLLIAAAKDKRFLPILQNLLSRRMISTKDAYSALCAAIKSSNTDAVRFLLKQNVKLSEHDMPFFGESLFNNFELFELLFNSTANNQTTRQQLIFLLTGAIPCIGEKPGDKFSFFSTFKLALTICSKVNKAIHPSILQLVRNTLADEEFIEFSSQYIHSFIGDTSVLQPFINFIKRDKLFPDIIDAVIWKSTHNKPFFEPKMLLIFENLMEIKTIADCLNAHSNFGKAAFHAAREGRWDILSYFINECKINIAKGYESGKTFIHVACEGGHLEIAKNLVKRKAYGSVSDTEGYTPAYYAAREGHWPVLSYLITVHHVNPSMPFPSGKTLIHAACERGHLQVVKNLIGLNVNPLVIDKWNNSPAFYAARHGHWSVLFYLIKKFNINLDKQYESGKTLILAACEGCHPEIVRDLVELKANPSIADIDGSTPISVAVNKDQPLIIRFLVKLGVDVNSTIVGQKKSDPVTNPKEIHDDTLLSLAASQGHMRSVRELMRLGADAGKLVRNGSLAWVEAAKNKHFEVAAYLYQRNDVWDSYWDFEDEEMIVAGLVESGNPQIEFKKIRDHLEPQGYPLNKILDKSKNQVALKTTTGVKNYEIIDIQKSAILLTTLASVCRDFVFPKLSDCSVTITNLCLSFLMFDGSKLPATTLIKAMQRSVPEGTSVKDMKRSDAKARKLQWTTNFLRNLNLELKSTSDQDISSAPSGAKQQKCRRIESGGAIISHTP